MSETRWPDGPYEISHEPPRWIIQAELPLGKKALAWMVGDYLECHNIAHLFAASPDLYAALEDLRKRFHKALLRDGTTEPYATIACEKADAALSKARGES